MLKSLILLSVSVCALGAFLPEGMLPQLDGRIVGGEATSISSFPWQVSIQQNGKHFCGGSIYSNKIIITAAHCLRNVSVTDLKVRAGSSYWSSGGVLVNVAAFKKHEGFNVITMSNDIAVIRLSDSLSYGPDIKNISLAFTAPVNGAFAGVSGWGHLWRGGEITSQLQYVNTKIIGRSQCASREYSYGIRIRPTMICAASAGKDACQGDSGGPLVSGNVLVGVVSWGIGCAQAHYPGIYADVAALRSWIVEAANSV